jgi:hypothetical protein
MGAHRPIPVGLASPPRQPPCFGPLFPCFVSRAHPLIVGQHAPARCSSLYRPRASPASSLPRAHIVDVTAASSTRRPWRENLEIALHANDHAQSYGTTKINNLLSCALALRYTLLPNFRSDQSRSCETRSQGTWLCYAAPCLRAPCLCNPFAVLRPMRTVMLGTSPK